MKKLKNYVRNKAKLEGSIAEGYVAEEALTFSSHYFRDVTTKFNRPDRNVDCPPPTCQFQVFKSLCKSIGLRSVIRIDHQELKKVIWYVLHNSPEIDTYRAKFKSEFPNKDMKEEFPGWFGKQTRQRHVDNDPCVRESSELFALAYGPSQTPISVNSCVVNGVRWFTSIDVDAPPDIIDVVDEDDDIIDEEDPIPHDLADSDDEDLVNLDIDDGVNVMSADVARGHGGDGGGDDRPPPYQTQFDLRPHMESDRWPQIYAGIQQHLQKIYNGKKAALKERYWVPEEDRTYDLERLRRGRPLYIFEVNWDAQLAFWNDPKNLARAAQNKQNRAKSKVAPNTPTVCPPRGATMAIVARASSGGDSSRCWTGFCQDRARSYILPHSKSDDKFSQMLNQFESQPEYGGGSESGGCGDDEPGDDEDGGEDEDDMAGILFSVAFFFLISIRQHALPKLFHIHHLRELDAAEYEEIVGSPSRAPSFNLRELTTIVVVSYKSNKGNKTDEVQAATNVFKMDRATTLMVTLLGQRAQQTHTRNSGLAGLMFDGSNVSFWNDLWIGDSKLSSMFPRIFSLETSKECTVHDRCNNNHGPKSKTWEWRQPIRGGPEECQLANLLSQIQDVDVVASPDSWECNLDPSKTFTVLALRKKIDSCILGSIGDPTRWNKALPIKINIHIWRLIQDRLPTHCNLDNRGIDIHSKRCPVCDEDLETTQHLFVDCFLAKSLWKKISSWWGFSDYPKILLDLIAWGDSTNLSKRLKLCLDVVIQTTIWVIWRYRNRLCFDLKPPRKDILEEEIKVLSYSWIRHRLNKSIPLWIDWIQNPRMACNLLL
ncbi:reverse transcriptase domain, reverse transcriptase zinc-binding domain protein [Tanacetum coccineum]